MKVHQNGIVFFNFLFGITVLTTHVVSFSLITSIRQKTTRGLCPVRSHQCMLTSIKESSTTTTLVEEEEENKTIAESVYTNGKVKLVFRAEKDIQSDPVSLPASASALDDFFETNKVTVLRGESNEVEEASKEVQDYLYQSWLTKSKEKGFAEPCKENDTIYKVINSGANFPGLKIKSKIYMGCKLIPSSESSSGYPEIENIMLNTKDYAEGPRFLVWLYKKLTGTSNNSGDGDDDVSTLQKDAEKESTNEACSKFYVTPSSDDTIIFHSSTNLMIGVEFSEFLLKVMPMDKEKSEQAGSESIAKVIEKDNGATLDIWTNAYKSWLDSI